PGGDLGCSGTGASARLLRHGHGVYRGGGGRHGPDVQRDEGEAGQGLRAEVGYDLVNADDEGHNLHTGGDFRRERLDSRVNVRTAGWLPEGASAGVLKWCRPGRGQGEGVSELWMACDMARSNS